MTKKLLITPVVVGILVGFMWPYVRLATIGVQRKAEWLMVAPADRFDVCVDDHCRSTAPTAVRKEAGGVIWQAPVRLRPGVHQVVVKACVKDECVPTPPQVVQITWRDR